MKTITLELPDEVAEAFTKLSVDAKVRILSKSLNEPTKARMEELLAATAREARENGMTEQDIDELIDSIS